MFATYQLRREGGESLGGEGSRDVGADGRKGGGGSGRLTELGIWLMPPFLTYPSFSGLVEGLVGCAGRGGRDMGVAFRL